MIVKPRKRRSRQPHSPKGSAREWVGGRAVSPFYITGGTPYRPEIVLWVEMPEGIVVSFELIDPGEEPVSFGATLLQAMATPVEGPPRKPSAVRVADASLAAEVRRVLPDARVVVAPTPEVDQVVERMGSDMAAKPPELGGPDVERSYFQDGRVGTGVVRELFRSAEMLYRMAPWKVAGDSQVLRVDIPACGVEAGCLSIIGALGESVGLILFPSLTGFERFLEAAGNMDPKGPIDLGTTTLCLNFQPGSDLPPGMLREAMEHGWPVSDASAYPVVQHRDRDGVLRPLTERDVKTMSACAVSLAGFFAKHRRRFEEDSIDEPVCESYFDRDDLEVRFTLPYEAGELFHVNRGGDRPGRSVHAPGTMGRAGGSKPPGRNQPCPCGSGRKYKVCCLLPEEPRSPNATPLPASRGAEASPHAGHDLDGEVVPRLDRFARRHFGPDWFVPAADLFRDKTLPAALMGPWTFYHHRFDGKPIVQWFLEDQILRLSPSEAGWLFAQSMAWLSVWEVIDTESGRSLSLEDLLTGEKRRVREVSASKTLVRRDLLLARVVDHQGVSLLCGLYPRALSPLDGAVVIERVRNRLRRRGKIPIERMREEETGLPDRPLGGGSR